MTSAWTTFEATGPILTYKDFPNPWARISEVAAKVGVGPTNGTSPTIIATGADGKGYDVWEVVLAVLDRLDAKAAQTR